MDVRFVGITLQEALDIAYEEDTVVNAIYIEPPESHVLTDEDSADEDEGGWADNLSSRQLSADAEIVLANQDRIGGAVEDPEEGEFLSQTENPQNESLTVETKPSAFTYREEADLESPHYQFPKGVYSKYQDMSCVQLFELFFSDDLLQYVVNQTRDYALFTNNLDPNVSVGEMKVFIGIMVLSGYNTLPSKRSYWENANDMKNILVSDAMRRDRFLQICRFIHFASNSNIDPSDEMYKLRPLADHLKTKFIENFVPEQNLSYDESMIRYFGRHGCKQFIRGKPVRFGYKVWSLNTPSGYLINFEIYQGKNPRANSNYEEIFGKAAAPLVQMIEELGEKKSFRFNFFFDNLFTGTNLLCTLKRNGYGGTGTIRDNRLPSHCPLTAKKLLEKQERGSVSSVLEKETGILFVRWMDNKVVTMASTCFGVAPVRMVDRFSRKEKKKIPVPRPNLIMQYNKNMGGTDQMDNNISW